TAAATSSAQATRTTTESYAAPPPRRRRATPPPWVGKPSRRPRRRDYREEAHVRRTESCRLRDVCSTGLCGSARRLRCPRESAGGGRVEVDVDRRAAGPK